jgi:hypothetical protein
VTGEELLFFSQKLPTTDKRHPLGVFPSNGWPTLGVSHPLFIYLFFDFSGVVSQNHPSIMGLWDLSLPLQLAGTSSS